MHARRGQPSNRNLDEKIKQKVLEILSRDVYRGFHPHWRRNTWPASTASV
jgi:hypothetical protein